MSGVLLVRDYDARQRERRHEQGRRRDVPLVYPDGRADGVADGSSYACTERGAVRVSDVWPDGVAYLSADARADGRPQRVAYIRADGRAYVSADV